MASCAALDLRYSPASHTSDLDGLVYAILDDLQPTAIHEHESADGWRVFFRTAAQRDRAAAVLANELGSSLTTIEAVDVDDENWAERSQASLKAVRVGRIIVAPPWDADPVRDARDDAVIVIIPSMGFGTGHHATTRLCLDLLQSVALAGQRVIDVGTGSGVLAVAAWRLGAVSVLAVDYDADALENARENIALNRATASIDLREADLSSFESEAADLVTANLTAAVIQKHAAGLRRLVRDGGHLILSGFAPDDVPDVLRAVGTDASRERIEGEWAALLITTPTRT